MSSTIHQADQEAITLQSEETSDHCLFIEMEPEPEPASCMHRVHYSLRNVNASEYEPYLLSIGPYHRQVDNVRFTDMTKCKQLYLESLCARTGMNRYFIEETMKNIEKKARACYSSSYGALESIEFVQMMVLDGCFIIELFRKLVYPYSHFDRDDPIMRFPFMINQVFRDLLLFENQLPLFVLEKLVELTKRPEDKREKFVDLALRCIQDHFSGDHFSKEERKGGNNHRYQLPGSPHLLGFAYLVYLPPSPVNTSNDKGIKFEEIPSATTLQEAGIQFKTNKETADGREFGVMKFTDDGVLEISHLLIDDFAECLFRNFVAYEQYSEDRNLHRITDYVILMDCLINTSKDVELLCHAGIITNYLGDDEKASKLFNELVLQVTYSNRTFRYAQEFNKVNKYRATRMNLLKAKLKRDYFNTPWAPISAFAGFILLVLTVIQTTFSVLSYVSPKS